VFKMIDGSVGSVIEDGRGMATIAINGQLRQAQHRPVCEHFALTGREDLGDDRCKIPILLDPRGNPTAYDIGRNQLFLPSNTLPLLHVKDAYGRVRTGSAGTVNDYANVYFECTSGPGSTAATAPVYPSTPGNTVVDGGVTFTCRNAWSRYAYGQALDAYTIQLEASPDPRATSDDTWFVYGGLFIRSGPLADFPKFAIRAWNSAHLKVSLFTPIDFGAIGPHTQMEIHAGCDLTQGQCFSRFNNITNLRAENFVPPPNFFQGL
jgi:Phage conserved hypothetical protein BR0599